MTVEALDDYPEPITSAKRAYQASLKLGITKGADRSRAVLAMAQAIEHSFDDILEANTLDLEASRGNGSTRVNFRLVKADSLQAGEPQ